MLSFQNQRHDEASRIKKEITLALKARNKSEKRKLRKRKQVKDEIRQMESSLKNVMENIQTQKKSMVKLMKVTQIKQEIQMISCIDQEARTLERTEEKLI